MVTDLEVANNCCCYKMRAASRAITRIYDEHLKSTGIKANQFSMLIAINIFKLFQAIYLLIWIHGKKIRLVFTWKGLNHTSE